MLSAGYACASAATGLSETYRDEAGKRFFDYLAAMMDGTMSARLEDLPNIGAYLAARLVEIDISTPEALSAVGAAEAYAQLKFRFSKDISLNALWAMDAALSGIDWRQLPQARKDALRAVLEGGGAP